MKIIDFAKKMDLYQLYDSKDDIEIEGVYIGDLLSIVMSKAKMNYAWITIQTHVNIVAVAELLDLSCIIVVEDMEVEQETIEKAKEHGIPLYKSKESAYETACRLQSMGIK
ncbi:MULTISPECIES: serine kinase [unclassified Sedimentibacter]|uniref:serine kinase n=1 Tax=unclassified Sedimentibacter TaxID=2649220 RepID=UPI0027DED9AA|nr:serine kinase [Sedimentibacter sp. MB35-C1]WMJ75898.1 serine kinase [Sedimentibacter sp. MB35-C1]